MDTPKSGQPPYNGQTVCPLPTTVCMLYRTSKEGTNSQQWTKHLSPTCPLFGGSTVDHPGSPSGSDIHAYSCLVMCSLNTHSHVYAVKVYCDMERVCGCDGGGGWMRVADINMIRFNINCPQGFPKITAAGKRMCRGQSSRCTSTTFSSHGIEYSRVCGRINGYQYSTTDAIDTAFVDGIVLTHGSPRQHIWTFAAANTQYGTGESGCPCNGHTVSFSRPPYIDNDYCTFVGDDYILL